MIWYECGLPKYVDTEEYMAFLTAISLVERKKLHINLDELEDNLEMSDIDNDILVTSNRNIKIPYWAEMHEDFEN